MSLNDLIQAVNSQLSIAYTNLAAAEAKGPRAQAEIDIRQGIVNETKLRLDNLLKQKQEESIIQESAANKAESIILPNTKNQLGESPISNGLILAGGLLLAVIILK